MKYKDIDRGFKKIYDNLYKLKGKTLHVGIFADAGKNKNGEYVVDYATRNEYGTSKIPSRSFMRSTQDEQKSNWQKIASDIVDKVTVDRKVDIDQLAGLLGERMVADIKAKINSNVPPPLSPYTIAKKGSDKTLIDTGIMRNSIKYKIVDNEK